MRNNCLRASLGWVFIAILLLTPFILADTVILHDGSSYSGRLTDATNGEVAFTDSAGVKYKLPVADVQTVVFTSSGDTVTPEMGKFILGATTGLARFHFKTLKVLPIRFLSRTSSLSCSRTPSLSLQPRLAARR
jgi:hypothetical protein